MSFENCEPLVYNSSESDADEAVLGDKKAVVKRVFEWVYKQTFDNSTEAKKWIDEQSTWSIKTTHDTEAGQRILYRCNQVPVRGKQCSAAMHIVYNSDSTKVNLFLNKRNH